MLASPRTLVGRMLRWPLRFVPAMRPVRILSGPLRGKRWLSTSGTHGCWIGTYERDLQRLLAASLKPGDVFFDIGANVGFFSLLGASLVEPTGHVYAFEPFPRNVGLLERNLALNEVANVTIFPAAVADTEGWGNLGSASSPSQNSLGSEGLRVSLVSLDALSSAGRLSDPSAMKIDVEGAESRVLAGARRMLERCRPLIFLSTHGHEQHDQCWQYLQALGYRLRLRRDGVQDGQYESIAEHPLRKDTSRT